MLKDGLSSFMKLESLNVSGDDRCVGLGYIREIRELFLERKGI